MTSPETKSSYPRPPQSLNPSEGIGERSRSGRGAEGGGEAVLVRVSGAGVLVLVLRDEVADEVQEDMLREARHGARGEKSQGGHTRSVKGGWLATSVVTRGSVAEIG